MIPCAEADGPRISRINPPNNWAILHLRFIPSLPHSRFRLAIFDGCIGFTDSDLEEMGGWWKRSIEKVKLF